ncbi:MAG: hypothetical protein Q4E00_06395, partial [Actinomyces bowdenii]|nr:hypothetical protein [Actinomyces bowdenii]
MGLHEGDAGTQIRGGGRPRAAPAAPRAARAGWARPERSGHRPRARTTAGPRPSTHRSDRSRA